MSTPAIDTRVPTNTSLLPLPIETIDSTLAEHGDENADVPGQEHEDGGNDSDSNESFPSVLMGDEALFDDGQDYGDAYIMWDEVKARPSLIWGEDVPAIKRKAYGIFGKKKRGEVHLHNHVHHTVEDESDSSESSSEGEADEEQGLRPTVDDLLGADHELPVEVKLRQRELFAIEDIIAEKEYQKELLERQRQNHKLRLKSMKKYRGVIQKRSSKPRPDRTKVVLEDDATFANKYQQFVKSLKNMKPSVPTRPKRPKKSAFEVTLDKQKYMAKVEKAEKVLLRLEKAKLRMKEHRRQEILGSLEESRQRLARIEEKVAAKKLRQEKLKKKKASEPETKGSKGIKPDLTLQVPSEDPPADNQLTTSSTISTRRRSSFLPSPLTQTSTTQSVAIKPTLTEANEVERVPVPVVEKKPSIAKLESKPVEEEKKKPEITITKTPSGLDTQTARPTIATASTSTRSAKKDVPVEFTKPLLPPLASLERAIGIEDSPLCVAALNAAIGLPAKKYTTPQRITKTVDHVRSQKMQSLNIMQTISIGANTGQVEENYRRLESKPSTANTTITETFLEPFPAEKEKEKDVVSEKGSEKEIKLKPVVDKVELPPSVTQEHKRRASKPVIHQQTTGTTTVVFGDYADENEDSIKALCSVAPLKSAVLTSRGIKDTVHSSSETPEDESEWKATAIPTDRRRSSSLDYVKLPKPVLNDLNKFNIIFEDELEESVVEGAESAHIDKTELPTFVIPSKTRRKTTKPVAIVQEQSIKPKQRVIIPLTIDDIVTVEKPKVMTSTATPMFWKMPVISIELGQK